jgi:hypothetical protein
MAEQEPKDPRRNQRLGPGFWVDQNDKLHISLTEILEAVDLPINPENMDLAREIAVKLLKERYPDAQVVDRKTKDD